MRRPILSSTTVSALFLASLAHGSASAAIGGPDAYGYTFADQAEGVVYNYVDITATGMLVVSGDNEIASVALGAPFELYDTTYLDLLVDTNGFLTDDPTSADDLSNDCPIPDIPSTGGGARVYAMHDDYVADVYYQYFDEVEAAAAGFAGETAGISIFQWTGIHFGAGGTPVDFETVLFHDDGSILTMVSADGEQGASSTLGMQDASADIGLNYACNTAMSVVPGVTAVQYTRGPEPDSICCAGSPTSAAGCVNGICQDIVCDLNDFCCTTQWDGICAGLAQTECMVLCQGAPAVTINEIRIAQPGADVDEYFELIGPPGTPLDDIQYIVLGDIPSGTIESVVDLTGQVIPPSGLFVVGEGGFSLGVADFTATINFEDPDTVTHMLVGGLNAGISDNLDGNTDGVLDFTPWLELIDVVAVVHDISTEFAYGPGSTCVAGPSCQTVNNGMAAPAHVFRCPNAYGPWQEGTFDPAAMDALDTPGMLNPCECGNGVIEPGETCDDAGESPTCDFDCSAPSCGDGVPNVSAGEECDDAGESSECDPDCTLAACGDGQFNPTAGEACDDAGESATCDADCTAPECGDMVANAAAGEDCDDGGESAACNADCTAAQCGDGLINTTAGETCDDGGRSDLCDADCTSVGCGDGVVNATAGEECDGDGAGAGGETETCDVDCTTASCGDGQINAAAGEACDDAGESEDCNDDCTVAACGDGVVNTTAGEACDDGNTDDGDACSADCTEEMGGSTGSTGDTADTGLDETAGPADSTGGPSTVSDSLTAGSSGGDTDTDTGSGGVIPTDGGCNCTAGAAGSGRSGTPWSVLALFGLGALSRRRRRR